MKKIELFTRIWHLYRAGKNRDKYSLLVIDVQKLNNMCVYDMVFTEFTTFNDGGRYKFF